MTFVVLIGVLAANSHADFTSALAAYSHHAGAYAAIIAGGKANGAVFGISIAAAVAIIRSFSPEGRITPSRAVRAPGSEPSWPRTPPR